MKKILLIITGSISAYKGPSIANALRGQGYEVTIVLTKAALKFITKLSFSSQGFKTYTDEDDWIGERVLHIDLAKKNEKFLIAPCTANTLAKISNGFADNLATNIIRAIPNNKKLYIALAMNTEMYKRKTTKKTIKKLKKEFINVKFIKPESKKLACGDIGIGALAKIDNILKEII